jgi:serine/threonine protein kinase
VHRDLKLENILFKDVEDLYVKVIDFGISGVCTTF